MLALLIAVALAGPATDPYIQDGWQPIEPTYLLAALEEEQVNEPEPLPVAEAKPKREWSGGVEQWRPLVAGHFEPGDVDRVLCLMGFESGGDPSARNPSGASGLLQVMPFWADHYGIDRADLFVPEINLWVARKIRDSQGWRAWSPYKRGECH